MDDPAILNQLVSMVSIQSFNRINDLHKSEENILKLLAQMVVEIKLKTEEENPGLGDITIFLPNGGSGTACIPYVIEGNGSGYILNLHDDVIEIVSVWHVVEKNAKDERPKDLEDCKATIQLDGQEKFEVEKPSILFADGEDDIVLLWWDIRNPDLMKKLQKVQNKIEKKMKKLPMKLQTSQRKIEEKRKRLSMPEEESHENRARAFLIAFLKGTKIISPGTSERVDGTNTALHTCASQEGTSGGMLVTLDTLGVRWLARPHAAAFDNGYKKTAEYCTVCLSSIL